jgi:hypothetical protein
VRVVKVKPRGAEVRVRALMGTILDHDQQMRQKSNPEDVLLRAEAPFPLGLNKERIILLDNYALAIDLRP